MGSDQAKMAPKKDILNFLVGTIIAWLKLMRKEGEIIGKGQKRRELPESMGSGKQEGEGGTWP